MAGGRQMPDFRAVHDRAEPLHDALGEIGRQPARKQQRRNAKRGRRDRDILLGERRREIEGKLVGALDHAQARAGRQRILRTGPVPERHELVDRLEHRSIPDVLGNLIRDLCEARVKPPVRIALAQQRRQHRLDQRQAAQAMRERRTGCDLERNRAAVGMADEMDRSLRVVERAAEGPDFFRERQRQIQRASIGAIARDIGGEEPMAAPEFIGERLPLAARAERAMQRHDASLVALLAALCARNLNHIRHRKIPDL